MKKVNYFLWYFPLCFFVFLAIYMTVKFIFIFFFKATFEPGFMFDLTPYCLLSGVNNLHLVVLSLIVIWFDVYLHVKVSKRNLLFSFLPTGIMLAGLGVQIASKEMVISNVFHYLVFGCLLVIILINHKHILMFPEIIVIPRKKPVIAETAWGKSIITKAGPEAAQVSVIEKPIRIEGIDEILTLHKETLSDLRSLIEDDLQRAEKVMDYLERKTKKIDRLGEEIEERRKNLVQEERLFRRRFVSSLDNSINVESIRSDDGLGFVVKKGEKTSGHQKFLDKIPECAAIVRRGVLKQVNGSFAELLGYDIKELVDKSLFDFVVPEGLSEIEKYYFNRLKGKDVSSYETIFLTSDDERIPVEINIKPVLYDGEKGDIAIVKSLAAQSKKKTINQ